MGGTTLNGLDGVFKVFQSWGPSAITSALVVVVVYLVKKVNDAGKEEALRSKNLQDNLDSKVKEVKRDINNTLVEHSRELSYIKMECIMRDTFYRELSGWKEDINRLSNQINSLVPDFMTRIIELWKEQK